MTFRHKLASLVFAAPLLGVLASVMPGAAHGQAAPAEGVWKEGPHKLALKIEVEPNNDLILREANPNDCCNLVGALIGEAHPRGPDLWIGRHIWGGPKQPPRHWGAHGGLLIRRLGDGTLFVQYRDSVYSAGWVYKKAGEP
jgi:hypothetical protein